MLKIRSRKLHALEDYDASYSYDRNLAEAYKTMGQIWMLRILCRLDGIRRVGRYMNIDPEDLVTALELEVEPGEEVADVVDVPRLSRRLSALESSHRHRSCLQSRNLAVLVDALSLEPVDRELLEFLVLLRKHAELGHVSALLGDSLTLGDAIEAIAVILEQPVESVRASVGPKGRLVTSGLIQVEGRSTGLADKFLLWSRLLEALSMRYEQPEEVLSCFVTLAPPPELAVKDFEDYAADFTLLRTHLRKVAGHGRKGCNILIYGEPGVGKTQMVRVLAKDLGWSLCEVTPCDRDGEPLSGSQRLAAFQMTQRFLGTSRNSLILFDEVEDVFPNAGLNALFGKGDGNARKGWFNEQLETNTVPVCWVANDISQIDPAHIRRFDMVINLRPMSPRARERVLRSACRKHGLKTGPWVVKAAQSRYLSPALIEKVSAVVASTRGSGQKNETAIFERVANGALNAMNRPPLKLVEAKPLLPYSTDILGTDVDIEGLVEGLRRTKEGRLLCYGPPGTGKTAFARHLAEQLKLPLMQFRASDILGQYVGMTERNIAQAFRQAREEGAIMLLDEIDSLLRSREGASRSWEVSQVNELLVQMEDHPGILIACTNFQEGLDDAASRRFDVKIEFNYMTPQAAWAFFQKVLRYHKVNFSGQKQAIRNKVLKLQGLTPGDFNAAVRKLLTTKGGVTAEGLVQALGDEVRGKPVATQRGIGFSARI